jgi:hypothetical protein
MAAVGAPGRGLAFLCISVASVEFTMTQGENKIRISVKLDYISDRILGNQLMGAWSMETGVYGLLELELKK